MVNRSRTSNVIFQGAQVAKAFAVNCNDIEHMVLLKEPLPDNESTYAQQEERQEPEVKEEDDDPQVDVNTTEIGQLGPETRQRVVELLEWFRVLSPKNTKVVSIKHGRKVDLPLHNENVTPFACKAQRWSPHMADLLLEQINEMLRADILRFSNSEWCSRIVPVPKSDGTVRICIDHSELNKLIKKDSGGLGDIVGMLDRMKGSMYFTSLDLASA